MSHSQSLASSDSTVELNDYDGFGELADFPLLSDGERDKAHDLVESGKIRSSIEPLIGLLLKLGLRTRGLRGCVQVPYGKPVNKSRHRSTIVYKSTIPVWVVDVKGPTNRESRRFLSTSEFVNWLEETNKVRPPSHGNSVGQLAAGFGTRLSLAGTASQQVTAQSARSQRTVRPTSAAPRAVPLPSVVSATPRSVARATPLPSSIGRSVPVPSTSGGPVGSPPSYVSQLGDVRPSFNRAELDRLESEFQSTPRVQLNGVEQFDESEYFGRLDALNAERQRQGFSPVEGVTPSTYVR